MIVQSAFKCLTCKQPHTVRISLGHGAHQTHRFTCQQCGEDMEIEMHLDQERAGWRTEVGENAERIEEVEDAPIVNADASFMVPIAERHQDGIMPRHRQMWALSNTGNTSPVSLQHKMYGTRPFRHADFDKEWTFLKKAWGLHRRGRDKLSHKQLKAASSDAL